MPGPIDKYELKFVSLNYLITTDTSEVQKCPFSVNHIHLHAYAQTCLMDQAFKA